MIAVLGCGHPHCGDDAVGLLVVQEIERQRVPDVRVQSIGTTGLAMLDAWEGCDACIVVDAMVSGRPAGSSAVLPEADWALVRSPPASSTHSLGPAEALRLAAALGVLPARLAVIGVEGLCFAPGAALSPLVHAGLGRAAQLVLETIAEFRRAAGSPPPDPSGTATARH